MVNIKKKELEIDNELKKRIEFICSFCNTTPTIINDLACVLIDEYHLETSQNEIIKSFSEKLTGQFGQGFSVPSLKKMKKFYKVFNGGSPHCGTS